MQHLQARKKNTLFFSIKFAARQRLVRDKKTNTTHYSARAFRLDPIQSGPSVGMSMKRRHRVSDSAFKVTRIIDIQIDSVQSLFFRLAILTTCYYSLLRLKQRSCYMRRCCWLSCSRIVNKVHCIGKFSPCIGENCRVKCRENKHNFRLSTTTVRFKSKSIKASFNLCQNDSRLKNAVSFIQ